MEGGLRNLKPRGFNPATGETSLQTGPIQVKYSGRLMNFACQLPKFTTFVFELRLEGAGVRGAI